MFVMKCALPRRTFLRGMGTAIALPLLDSMVPAVTALAKTAARSPLRVGFVYMPNGQNMPLWTPTEEGSGFTMSPTLQPLEPFRDQMLVLSGLSARPAEGDGGVHARPSATWLSQVAPAKAEGIGARAGTTFDQRLAAHIGTTTKLRSLEVAIDDISMVGNCESGFSCTYFNTLCWRHAHDAGADESTTRAWCSSNCSATAARPWSARRRCSTTAVFSIRSRRKWQCCGGGWGAPT